jgi:hypothetical protein
VAQDTGSVAESAQQVDGQARLAKSSETRDKNSVRGSELLQSLLSDDVLISFSIRRIGVNGEQRIPKLKVDAWISGRWSRKFIKVLRVLPDGDIDTLLSPIDCK